MTWYTPSDKQRAYRRCAKAFRALAADLGLPPGSYDIRPCYSGPAVAGEAVFHSNSLYISFALFPDDGFSFFRSCKGRKDYTGGQNHIITRFPTAEVIRRALPQLFPTAAVAP
jgi:hypothetical protein